MSELLFAVRWTIGLVFIGAAVAKIGSPRELARGIERYRLLPSSLTFPAALAILTGEMLSGLAHLFLDPIRLGAALGVAMLAIFGAAVASALRRGLVIPCQCFGRQDEMISASTLNRLALLFAGEAFLLASPPAAAAMWGGGAILTPRPLVTVAVWMAALVAGGLLVSEVSGVVELLRPCPTCGPDKSPLRMPGSAREEA